MFKFKHVILLLLMSIMLFSCESGSDNPSKVIEKSELFKLSMKENVNFGNLDVSGVHKAHSQSVTVTNSGKFAVQLDLPKTNSEDLTITSADDFNNPLKPGMSYDFRINYAPKTFGDKSTDIDISEYLHLPKENLYGGEQGFLTSSKIYKATFINEDNEEFDGVLKINAKYSEVTNPKIVADVGEKIDFGYLGKNNTALKDVILKNIGDGNAIISDIEVVSDNKIFTIILPENFKGHFQPEKEESFQVQAITDELTGTASAKLLIYSNSVNSPLIIDLVVHGDKLNIDFSGSGGINGGGQVGGVDSNGNKLGEAEVAGFIDFETNTIDFGLVSLNKPRVQRLSIKNTNDGVLRFHNILESGSGLNVDEEQTTCLNNSLYDGDSCDIYIEFTPTIAQKYDGFLQINSQIGDGDIFSIHFDTTGEGIEPKLLVDKEVDFNRVGVGDKGVKQLVIKNIGKDILKIDNIFLDKKSRIFDDTEAFTFNASQCVKKLKQNEQCALDITYTPLEYGEIQKYIIIQSNDKHVNHHVELKGIGSGSSLSLNNEIDFGSVNKSVIYDLVLTNIGYDPIYIDSTEFRDNKNFRIKNNSCSVIKINKPCSIQIEFTPPQDSSDVTDVLSITFNGTEHYNVLLMGGGLQPETVLSVKEDELLDFGRVGLGSAGEQSVFIRNIGNAPLELSDFKIENIDKYDVYNIIKNTCADGLVEPDNECEVVISAAPTFGGTVSDTLSFISNELINDYYEVNLTAFGTFSELAYSASTINFGDQYIYPEQLFSKDLNIKNTGTEPVTIKGAEVIDGYFDIINNCSVLNSSESCNISVQATPTTAGKITDTLTITSDVPSAPMKAVELMVTGLDRVFELSPLELDFGSVHVGSVSETKSFTITNTGNVNLSISDITATAPFSVVSHTCGSLLEPDGTCNILVNVLPVSDGVTKGTLTIESNALREPVKQAALSVIGQLESKLIVDITSLDFGDKYIYPAQSYSKSFTISNTGNAPFTVTGIASTNNSYTLEHSCLKEIAGGESCSVLVKITPNKAGDITGTVNITTNANVNPNKSVSLRLKGLDRIFTVSSTSLNFGSVPVSTLSSAKSVTIKNTGNIDLSIKSVTAGAPFTVSGNTCGATLAPNGTCKVDVKVTPNKAGSNTGTLTVTTDALKEATKTVSLAVTGTVSSYSVSATSLNFGTVEYNTESAAQTITVTNTGSLPITFSAPTVPAPYLLKSNTCSTLQAGAKCTIGIAVKADRVGTIPGTLIINGNSMIEPNKQVSMQFYSRANILHSGGPYTFTSGSSGNKSIEFGKYRITVVGAYGEFSMGNDEWMQGDPSSVTYNSNQTITAMGGVRDSLNNIDIPSEVVTEDVYINNPKINISIGYSYGGSVTITPID